MVFLTKLSNWEMVKASFLFLNECKICEECRYKDFIDMVENKVGICQSRYQYEKFSFVPGQYYTNMTSLCGVQLE